MTFKFNPITGKTAEIVETLMDSPDMTADMALQFKIRLCVEEVVENIVSYAYTNGEGPMEASVLADTDGTITLVFKDRGVPFDPLAKPDPDITLSAEDRPIGGLGIFLCKQMMDNVRYEYTDGQNVLTMVKKAGQ